MELNELQICITSVCNIGCNHCHLSSKGDHMDFSTFTRSVLLAKGNGIDTVRLTGGTIFEHPELLSMLDFLKKEGLKVIVNISYLSLKDFFPIAHLCDYVLFSFYSAKQVNEFNQEVLDLKGKYGDELFIMGCAVYNSNWFKQIPLLSKSVDVFDSFFFLRDTTKTDNDYFISLNECIERCSDLTKKIFVANGFPMCNVSKRNLKLCSGAKFDNANERFYVKPDGTLKPSAYSDIEFGNVNDSSIDFGEIWAKNQVKIDNIVSKNENCKKCSIYNYCKGGIVTLDSDYKVDPLLKHAVYNKYPTKFQKILRTDLFKFKKLDDLKISYHENSSFYMQYPPSDYWKDIEKDELLKFFKLKDGRLNVYIHFPFCIVSCKFCNVAKFSVLKRKAHIDDLLRRIDEYKELLSNNDIGSVYFGGGSPQLMGYEGAKPVFERLFSYFRNKPSEVNFEMFPKDFDLEMMTFIRKYVTRVSMGVQCFNEDNLKRLNRFITKAEMIDYIKKINELKFDYVNLDVIFGLFMNNPDEFENDFREILSMGSNHITYQPLHFTKDLGYDEGDNMKNMISINTLGRKILREKGFTQNSAEDFSNGKGLEYQGAMLNQENLLGIGDNTFGLINKVCYKQEGGKFRAFKLGLRDELFGKLFLSSRFLKVDVSELDSKYNISYKAFFSDSIRFLLSIKFIEFDKNVIVVTEKGLDYVDMISNILSLSNLDYKLRN